GEQVSVTYYGATFGESPTTFSVDDVRVSACGGYLPDLMVTDVWAEGSEVCYQLLNQGDYTADGSFFVKLDRVEVEPLAEEWITITLSPNERMSRCFDYSWECAGSFDPLVVIADANQSLPEWNNDNNWREESWQCDVTPPQLASSPHVTAITADSAVVEWETNEPGDSQVLYSQNARGYEFERYDEELVQGHSVTLYDLTPGIVYRYMVTSADEANNRSAGVTSSFQTLPEDDGQDPTVSLRDPGIWQDKVTVTVDVDDNRSVQKVAFCLESGESGREIGDLMVRQGAADDFCLTGELLWTDYSAPFQVAIDTTMYDNGSYTLTARGYDPSGRSSTDFVGAEFANLIDPDAPIVTITSPTEGQAVSGKTQVTAQISDENGLAYVYFWVNGEFEEFYPLPNNPKSTTLTFDWDTTLVTKTNTVLAVDALDIKFNQGRAIRNVTVSQPSPPAQPQLKVTSHTVTRDANAIQIALTVTNVGQGAASSIELVDTLQLYQPISREETNPHAISYQASFLATPIQWYMTIDDSQSLAAGASRTYTYYAVPVMLYPNPLAPSVGKDVYIYYQDSVGKNLSSQTNYPVTLTTGNQPIDSAWVLALKEATYLLTTNPQRLYWYHVNDQPVDDLLSAMAELAYYKQGALGYLYVYDKAALDSLIEPPTFYSLTTYGDNWAYRLDPDFLKPLTGALLIVGETEIVPAWTQSGFSIGWGAVNYSDQPYADTGGSPAPELLVGRIVGDSAATMIKPIQASIGVYTGSANYAFDQAAALAISGPGLGSFVQDVDDISLIFHDEGYQIAKVHTKDYSLIDSFARAFDTGDEIAVGEVWVAGVDEEIVFFDASLDTVTIYNKAGNVFGSFSVSYDATSGNGDDQIGIVNNHIVKADASGDRILVFDSLGAVLYSFAVPFDAYDVLAVGDVTSGSLEEIIIGDHSANRVDYYSEAGIKQGLFVSQTFDPFDLLAVGDVLGDTKDEVVFGDKSTGKLLIYSAAGVQQGALQLASFTVNKKTLTALEYYDYDISADLDIGGSALEIGELFPYPSGADSGKEEILLAPARNSDHMFPFWWYATESKLREAAPVPWNFDEYEGLGIGDLGIYELRNQDEILVADNADYIRLLDTNNWERRWISDIPIHTRNTDVILLSGHGNEGGCCGVNSFGGNTFPLDFNGQNPVAMGISCLTGNYQDSNDKQNFPDRMLDSGAAVYIGSTENSNGYQNREAAKWLFKNWDYGESIGKAFTELERTYWKGSQTDDWWFWAYEYNLYGDPKFSAETTRMAAESELNRLPESVIEIEVPDYEVSDHDGLDWVEIPGGRLWSEPGDFWLPYYSVSYDLPAGERVHDVNLLEHSGLVTDTGIILPMTSMTLTTDMVLPEAYSGPVDDWYPEAEFEWYILDNGDGSSMLVLSFYPFVYNPLTTDVRFYKNYRFEVITSTIDLLFNGLSMDKAAYEPGETLNIEVGVENSGEEADVIVSARIVSTAGEEEVAGLPLVLMEELQGMASVSMQWDSSGIEPGSYLLEVTLMPVGEGQPYDLETQIFELGITGGAITEFSAEPSGFQVGDDIEISLTFENTGTVALDGVVVIQVLDESGEIIAAFRPEFSGLAPNYPVVISDIWQTIGVKDGTYNLVAYVSYGGYTTEPEYASVSTGSFIFLPLIVRGSD
ncbi:MAG: hypothetical protein JXA42_10365, partial [Anaerolineales bacterium]|nr:hypothetical protein [Anaerolineales bacterium]